MLILRDEKAYWICYMNNHDRMRFNFLRFRGKKTCIDAPAR